MEFGRAYDVGFKEKYFCFSGRASRSEHNYFMLFLLLIGFTEMIYGFFLSEGIANFISLIISLVFFLPSLGMAVRRLHDMNYSGWWLLAPLLGGLFTVFILTILSVLFLRVQDLVMVAVVIATCSVIPSLWLTIVLIFKKGTDGENRFGLVPE